MAPIDALNPDVLGLVLSHVLCSSSTASSSHSFLSTILCCRRWRDIAQPMYYKDLTLTNQTLPRFSQRFTSTANAQAIHSLSVLITPDNSHRLPDAKPGTQEFTEGLALISRAGCLPAQRLWANLEGLATKLRQMSNLVSFSLSLVPNVVTEGFFFKRETLGTLVSSLPKSCTALSLDTRGEDRDVPGTGHLCEALHEILPRLEHLRLRLALLCPSIFSSLFEASGVLSPRATETPLVTFPALKTCVVNLCARPMFGHTLTCGTRLEPGWTEARQGPEARISCLRALQTIGDEQTVPIFPSAQRVIFVSRQIPTHFKSVHGKNEVNNYTIDVQDVVQEETKTYSCCTLYSAFPSSIVRLEDGKEVAARLHDVEDLVEGELWVETTTSAIVPRDWLKRGRAPEAVYHKNEIMLASDRAVCDKARNSRIIWTKNDMVGQRLQKSRVVKWLTDLPPLQEPYSCSEIEIFS